MIHSVAKTTARAMLISINVAIALSITATISQHSSAASATFFCDTKNNTPVTVASTSRGDIPVIRWVSAYFSGAGYTPVQRCMEVSKRFQTYYNNGTLNYITAGTINTQPVVCVAKSPGSGCSEVLFTLENKDNPFLVLQELFNVRLGTASQPITRGSGSDTPIYIDFNKYLNTGIVELAIPGSLESILEKANPTTAVTAIEQTWERDYEAYFNADLSVNSLKAEEIANTLGKLGNQTGKKPALIYMVPGKKQLELILVLPNKEPIHKSIPEADRQNLMSVVKEFNKEIGNPSKTNTTSYKAVARKLYQWAIAPLEPELKTNNIDTLLFCVGAGLRNIPLAALYDGQKFLVEKYSIGLIPAFNMTDSVYRDIKNARVLAMGASEFTNQNPLAAVPVELSAIMQDLSGVLWPGPWRGKILLNQEFTLNNLKSQRASQPFGIVHLATHAEFKAGAPGNSYIQFWDTRLGLDKMRELRWNNPPVDLLVLSACRTAVGDKDAERGFAGLAVQSGVKTALASLWNVSDEGTLALMTEFYQQLRLAPIKTEALRQAQIAMIRGQVRLEGGELRGTMLGNGVKLPPSLAALENQDFSHPYYWAAFTMIGNPW